MTNAYLIGYDLNQLGQRYSKLKDLIERLYPGWWHCLDSTYIIKTPLSAYEVRDSLGPALDANDVLLVIPVTRGWASYNLGKQCADWLTNNL